MASSRYSPVMVYHPWFEVILVVSIHWPNFRIFAKTLNFEHSSSSPYHQQSNGLGEKYGNIAKNLLDKAKADEKDPYISLLDYRNTPINDVSSPAQLLMNRGLRGKLPATQKQLIPKAPNIRRTREKMKINKMKQKNYYDRHAKDQSQFRKGQTVRFQDNSKLETSRNY